MINQKRTIKRDSMVKALAHTKRQVFKSRTAPPKSGSWKNEHSFKTAISTKPHHSDKLFVVGIVDEYHNHSIDDKNWVVYVYDMDGEFIERIAGQKLGGKFFMNLTYIQ